MAIWKDRPAALLFGPAKRAMTSCNIGPLLLTLPFWQIVIVLGGERQPSLCDIQPHILAPKQLETRQTRVFSKRVFVKRTFESKEQLKTKEITQLTS